MKLPRKGDQRPPYVQLADTLRERIKGGRYKPGAKLPSARELQAEYGVASGTVQNALKQLKKEGLVYSVQSHGTYVRDGAMPANFVPSKGTPPATIQWSNRQVEIARRKDLADEIEASESGETGDSPEQDPRERIAELEGQVEALTKELADLTRSQARYEGQVTKIMEMLADQQRRQLDLFEAELRRQQGE